MANLPLRIRTAIRDSWDAPTTDLNQAVKALGQELGLDLVIKTNWEGLWSDLETRYPDKATFIPSIVAITLAWVESVNRYLKDEEWADRLLEKLSAGKQSHLELFILTAKGSHVWTEWMERTSTVALYLPKDCPVNNRQENIQALTRALDTFFSPGVVAQVDNEDSSEWMEVIQTEKTKENEAAVPLPFDDLPQLVLLEKPEVLFAVTVPYTLSMTAGGDEIFVQCSHEGTLEVLKQYFSKYSRIQPGNRDQSAMLKIDLIETSVGFGPMFNSLRIKPIYKNSSIELNPTLILTFLEGVLGYKIVHTDGRSWQYRRDKPFKKSR